MHQVIAFFKKPCISYIIVSAAFIISIVYYYPYRYNFLCNDLALKVEASRLMAQGSDAYYMAGESGQKMVNGVVSTPFVNLLHRPLTVLSSCGIKNVSFWVHYALLALCLCFTFWLTKHPVKRCIQCGVVIFFFIASRYWFFSLRLGQVYPLYTMLLFLLYFLKAQKLDFLFGVVLVISIACRPIFILPAVLLSIFFFNRRLLQGLLTGFTILALVTLLTNSLTYWPAYFKAMKAYAEQLPASTPALHTTFHIGHVAPDTIWSDCKGTSTPMQQIFTIRPGSSAGLLQPLQGYFIRFFNLVIISTTFYSVIALALSVTIVWLLKRRFAAISTEKYAVLFFVIYIITEICVPAPRAPYNFIFWLFGAALIIAKGNYGEILLIIAGLCLAHDIPPVSYIRDYGELLMLLACFLFIFRRSNQASLNYRQPITGNR